MASILADLSTVFWAIGRNTGVPAVPDFAVPTRGRAGDPAKRNGHGGKRVQLLYRIAEMNEIL
jgi:hypothetical protein